jgi:hypothetical protein
MTAYRIRTAARVVSIVAAFAVSASSAAAQDHPAAPPYGSTLTFGTGLVSIPVAWVSRSNGDLFASMSTRKIGFGATPATGPSEDVVAWDLTQTLELHLAGRASIGVSLYGTKYQQIGFSGQFLAVRQPEPTENGPIWLPSVSLGFRNLGASSYQDRFVTGERRATDAYGTNTLGAVGKINGAPTLYGVATKEIWLGKTHVSGSLGYGNGLFKEDGGMYDVYNKKGQLVAGMFMGGRVALPINDRSSLSFMIENNGFDNSLGASYNLGFITVGAYLTEFEEDGDPPKASGTTAERGRLANYKKFAMSVSYNASLPGIVNGSRQRAEAADAKLELQRLTQEISQRRATTRELVAALDKAKSDADAAADAQRKSIIAQLQAEQAALKAAADRLEALSKKPPEKK